MRNIIVLGKLVVIRIKAIEFISRQLVSAHFVNRAPVDQFELAILHWHELLVFNEDFVLIIYELGILADLRGVGQILLLVLAIEPEAAVASLAEVLLMKLHKEATLG